MKNFCNVTIIVAAMAVIPHAALADYETENCKEDVAKFCSDVDPGEGRIALCLKEHQDQLSEACKSRSKEVAGRVQDIAQTCAAELDLHCSGVKPGGGRLLKCLKEHEADLAPDCKARLQARTP